MKVFLLLCLAGLAMAIPAYHNKRSAPEYRIHRREAYPDGPPAYGPPAPYHTPALLLITPLNPMLGANFEKAENQDASGHVQGLY